MMIIWPSNSRYSSKWRKEVDGAWRMDIDIVVDDNDEDEEMEDGNELSSIDKSEDSESEMSESESKQESSDDDNQAIDAFVYVMCLYNYQNIIHKYSIAQ